MVKDLMSRLVEYEIQIKKEIKSKEPTKKLEDIKEGIDILSMNSSKDPTDTDSSLELMLNIMWKSFKMKPKQAAALLTNSNQYLLHSVVKGLKGNYDPVIKFFRNMSKYCHHMSNLLELESQKNQNHSTMLMVLNALKTGIFSCNTDVITYCLELLTILSEVTFESSIFPAVYQWFITTTQEGGISAILYVLKKHEDLIKQVVSTLVAFSKGNLPNILKEIIRPLYPSPREYISVINNFVHVLAEEEVTRDELLDSGLIDFWLETNIKQADMEAKNSPEERTTSLAYVCDLWVLFPDKIDARDDLKLQLVNLLKKLSLEKFRPLRIWANAQTFRLLEIFARNKNAVAPTLLKNITYSLVENHEDSNTREYIMKNLISIMEDKSANEHEKSIPPIPVSFIVEPLIKLLQEAEGDTYIYNTCDFDFIWSIAKHPKLHPKNALQLIDFLAKIYLNDLSYATWSSVAFIAIAERFCDEHNIKGMPLLLKYFRIHH